MTSTLLTSYLGHGTLASRPASPAVDPGSIGIWWATDQAVGTQLSIYDGTSWTTATSGYGAGTPPTVVQFASNTGGGQSVTFGVAPTSGNLLVAMTFNPTSLTNGAGWTAQLTNSGGTDFGGIFTKTAGGAESTTQTPLGGGVPAVGAIACWEVHAGTGVPTFGQSLLQSEQTGITNVVLPLTNIADCLCLAAVSAVTVTISKALNVGTQDVLNNAGARRLVAGHTDLSKSPVGGIMTVHSASGFSKGATCILVTP